MSKIPIQCTKEQLYELARIMLYAKNEDLRKFFGKENYISVAEIKSCFERTDPLRWRAEDGELYYYVNMYGNVEPFTERKEWSDDKSYNSGNYFRTKEEAEAAAVKWRELFGGDNIVVP